MDSRPNRRENDNVTCGIRAQHLRPASSPKQSQISLLKRSAEWNIASSHLDCDDRVCTIFHVRLGQCSRCCQNGKMPGLAVWILEGVYRRKKKLGIEANFVVNFRCQIQRQNLRGRRELSSRLRTPDCRGRYAIKKSTDIELIIQKGFDLNALSHLLNKVILLISQLLYALFNVGKFIRPGAIGDRDGKQQHATRNNRSSIE